MKKKNIANTKSSIQIVINKIYLALTKINPFAYGLIYILMIPAFAVIYTYFMKGEFYHSTSRYEAYDTYYKEVLENINKNLELFNPKQEHLHFPFTSLYFDGVEYHLIADENYTGNVGLLFKNNSSLIDNQTYPSIEATFNPVYDKFSVKLDSSYFFIKVRIKQKNLESLDSLINKKVIDQLFTGVDELSTGDLLHFPVIKVDYDQYYKLLEIPNAKEGFPLPSANNFKRMMYFSTVTITTLGFGDIVPLTDDARTLTALESIFGVIFIGLFLNSVTARRNNNLLSN